jgi:protease-4
VSRTSVFSIVAVLTISFMVVAGIILAVVLAVTGGNSGPIWGERIAVLEIDGIIADDVRYLEQIQSYRRDSSVKGFLVVINSPGGVVGPAQSLYRELRRLRDEDGVPVVATIGAIGASGGYYVALGADSIFALPGSLTGSIGVIMEFPQARELMDRVGVDVQVIKSAAFKDAGSPYRRLESDDHEVLQGLIQDVYAQFVDVVAEERGLPEAEARRLADGRVYSGRQAFEAGLVDQIGNLNDALAAAGRMAGLGDEPRTIWPQAKKGVTLLDLVLGRGTAASLARLIGPLEQAGAPRLQYAVPF